MNLGAFITERWWGVASLDLSPDWRTTVERWHLPVLLRMLGDRDIASLSPEDCEIWWAALRREKTPGMANKILVTLKAVLNKAEVWNYVKTNPARTIKKAKGSQPRASFFTDRQRDTLLRKANKRLAAYLYVARYTGARRRSLLQLRWGDIDFEENTICFRKTKSGTDHTLPLHPELSAYFRARRDNARPDGFVLPRYTPGALSRAFKRTAIRIGLREARFHDTRHDVASRLAQRGVSIIHIKEILGHRDLRSTMRYAHLNKETIAKTMVENL